MWGTPERCFKMHDIPTNDCESNEEEHSGSDQEIENNDNTRVGPSELAQSDVPIHRGLIPINV